MLRLARRLEKAAGTQLSLVLLVPKKHPLTDARQLLARDTIDETLITFPRGDAVQRHLEEGLDALCVV